MSIAPPNFSSGWFAFYVGLSSSVVCSVQSTMHPVLSVAVSLTEGDVNPSIVCCTVARLPTHTHQCPPPPIFTNDRVLELGGAAIAYIVQSNSEQTLMNTEIYPNILGILGVKRKN